MSGAPAASPFRQPKAVFAVAFACVVSFMGIGLVDPILPAISSSSSRDDQPCPARRRRDRGRHR
jgi:hypothetical protein